MKKPGTAFLLAAFVFCLISPTPASAYIGGKRTRGALPATLKLVSRVGHECSAVKVADHFLLTAAHCNFYQSFNAGTEVFVLDHLGEVSEGHSLSVHVKRFLAHPSYKVRDLEDYLDMEDMQRVADLALVEIVEDLSIFKSATISFKPLSEGDKVVVGGFGVKGDGYPQYSDLTVASKIIQKMHKAVFEVGLLNADNKNFSMGAKGDSGGPAYKLDPATGAYVVVGINQCVNMSYDYFTVNPTSGALLDYDRSENVAPAFFIARLGYAAGEDRLDVLGWLTQTLLLPQALTNLTN